MLYELGKLQIANTMSCLTSLTYDLQPSNDWDSKTQTWKWTKGLPYYQPTELKLWKGGVTCWSTSPFPFPQSLILIILCLYWLSLVVQIFPLTMLTLSQHLIIQIDAPDHIFILLYDYHPTPVNIHSTCKFDILWYIFLFDCLPHQSKLMDVKYQHPLDTWILFALIWGLATLSGL